MQHARAQFTLTAASVGGLTSLEFIHPRETGARTACSPLRPGPRPSLVPLPTTNFSLNCFYCWLQKYTMINAKTLN